MRNCCGKTYRKFPIENILLRTKKSFAMRNTLESEFLSIHSDTKV